MTEKTTETVGEAPSFPVSMPSTETASGLAAVVIGIGSALMYFRRKHSRDGTEIVKDKVDGELTKSLMAAVQTANEEAKLAREETRKTWAEYNKLIVRVGQLEATNSFQKHEIDRLVGELTKAQDKLDQVRDDPWKLRKGSPDSNNAPLR